MLTGTLAVFAASIASRAQAAADLPSAGVMPVQWNHCAPANTQDHCMVPGAISLIDECARS